ncbi:lipoprotein NlpI [Flocculibacter collagenilyticus]|uniref:lipoprotein NlpI n=1 Tax=Flocculibacter collagenilyticus TaxID=2744479 RepID=UPI0018F453F4|nr:lipoprotein NlpI [Flocculibacter collagenilyticus]
MKLQLCLYLFFFILCLSGCASTSSKSVVVNSKPSLEHVILAEPLSVSYKSELTLIKLGEILQRAELTDEQRAKLYYDRGVIYDSIGLKSLARLDFNRAIRLKPDLADAYNFIGIHFTLAEDFAEAYEAFDSTLELQPDFSFAYLNRGISLYYGGRFKLAVDDFEAFYELDEDDPYRAVWLYIAEYEVDVLAAKNRLSSSQEKIDESQWAYQLTSLFLEEITPDQFLKGLTEGISTNHELADRLCEAYFYLGKLSAMKGDTGIAANFYKLSLATNVYEYVEHKYAKLELNRMRAQKAKERSTQENGGSI